jgi:hypothetical protein
MDDCQIFKVGDNSSFIVSSKRNLLLVENFQMDEDIVFTANGRILKSNDVAIKGIHRIVAKRRLKVGNPKVVNKDGNDDFYSIVQQYLRRRRGQSGDIETNLLISDDATFFENLLYDGYLPEVNAIILDKWWVFKDEIMFIARNIREKLSLCSKTISYEPGKDDPDEDNISELVKYCQKP